MFVKKYAIYGGELASLDSNVWGQYLDERSGLPGPRSNLELLAVAAEMASPETLEELVADADEYRRSVGTVGLGRRLAQAYGGPDTEALSFRLQGLATDPSWRVREAAAMALQRLGDSDGVALRTVVATWVGNDHPLVQRAAIAGICEPRLLKDAATAKTAVWACDEATAALMHRPVETRRDDDVRTLRKGLAYCWSVAIAALPGYGLERFRSLDQTDPDVAWVVKQNLTKARLKRVLAAEVAS